MTDTKKTAEVIADADLDAAQGGAAYLKLGDIDGESKVVNSFDLVGKRDIGTGAKPLPTEEVTLGYTEVEWTY